MVDSSGTIVSRLCYDPYGRTTLVSGSNLATFQYTGDYTHQPSGLNLTLYRAYDPNTARWLSRDPIGEHGGINLYEYANDDPTDLIDPLGLCCDLTVAVGHGHVPGWFDTIVPNTNNDYFKKHGNTCTVYGGCGSNALNRGGLGDDLPGVPVNNWNPPGDNPNGSDNARKSDVGVIATALVEALKANAKAECKKGNCKAITITIQCNPGTDIALFAGKSFCGKCIKIDCTTGVETPCDGK